MHSSLENIKTITNALSVFEYHNWHNRHNWYFRGAVAVLLDF